MAVRDVVQAAAGQGGDKLYVEDVFSTYLYTGNGSTQTITNGIDLDGEGGLVWFKNRQTVDIHALFDSERPLTNYLRTNGTNAEGTGTTNLAFNNNGFSFSNNIGFCNTSSQNYASWTFRKAPKFFDVVTYTGDGTTGRSITHSLGSVPGCIIVKRTDSSSAGDWTVYHRSLTANTFLYLNTTLSAQSGGQYVFGDNSNIITPTNTVFTVSAGAGYANITNATYVAYVFAHDAGGFGDDGEQNVISCGSYQGNSSTAGPVINLGFEAQWVLIKNITYASNWQIMDVMRGMPNTTSGSEANMLAPNLSSAEDSPFNIAPHPLGFQPLDGSGNINGSTSTYIYIAIRRPMKTPESGTEVFAVNTWDGTTLPTFTSNFVVDSAFIGNISGTTDNFSWGSRLTQGTYLKTTTTAAEASNSPWTFSYMDGFYGSAGVSSSWYAWMFRRAPGFMDVVAYTGDGVADRQIPHNLGVTPQLAFTKQRSGDANTNWWNIYFPTGQVRIFDTNAFSNWGMTASETWFEGDISLNNVSGKPYIAYLFASCPGVSKVGSYTGTGANLNVDCGFSAGARFVLIKRTDSTGDWYVWDSARGIVSGNDPYLLLNSTAAENTSTDYIDPLASGFTVTSSAPAALNASGGTYIFLAIA